MAASCRIDYIEEKFRKFSPELADKLNEIHVDIWREINNSKLFREYEKYRLFSKPGTEQNEKQKALMAAIDRKYNAPTTLFNMTPTKSGFNKRIGVNVFPIARQVFDSMRNPKQGDLFENQNSQSIVVQKDHLDGEKRNLIKKDGRTIGWVLLYNDGSNITVNDVDITEQKQGIGTEVYKDLGKWALENGLVLQSDLIGMRMNEASTKLWEKLVREGYAIKSDGHYLFVNDNSEESNNSNRKNDVETAIKNSLPIEISNIVNVIDVVSDDVLGRDDLFFSIKSILNDNGIYDELLINWIGINKDRQSVNLSNFKSEQQITDLIQKVYNRKKEINNHPELKSNKLALESFRNWVNALESYPIAFQELMLTHAIKYLNPQRRDKYVLQLSNNSLVSTYGLLVNKPHEANRIGKLYDQEVLKTVSDAVGHESSESGNGYWVHIPRTTSGNYKGYPDYKTFKKNTEAAIKFTEDFLTTIKEKQVSGYYENLVKDLQKLLDKKPIFDTQEPNLNREDANKYGFKEFEYIRVESSHGRQYDNPFPEFLGQNYKGYYIHGYNTNRNQGQPDRKAVPITKEEAEKLWEAENARYPNNVELSFEVGERQKVYNLEQEIHDYNPEQLVKRIKENQEKIDELKQELLTVKPEEWNGGAKNKYEVNVELLRKLSPSTWCTASGQAGHYVENFDNYLLIVKGVTVAGIEAYPKKDNLKPEAHFEGGWEVAGQYFDEYENAVAFISSLDETSQKALKELSEKRHVKEVTSRYNNGVAPIDHIDDVLAFFEKHNLDPNIPSINNAKSAKEKGKTDADLGGYDFYEDGDPFDPDHFDEPDGPYNPYGEDFDFDGYPNDPPDYEHEEFLIAEDRRIVSQMTNLEEVNANLDLVIRNFNFLPQELKDNEELANKAVAYDSHNVIQISPTVPFYEELLIRTLTRAPNIYNYLPEVIKNIPVFQEVYERGRQVELVDDLPFSKTNTNKIQGYYDVKNDKVVVVASNTPIAEAAKIAIHEVAHRGMLRMAKDLGGFEELSEVLFAAEKELMKKLPDLLKRTGHKNLENLLLDYGFDPISKEGKIKLLMELSARWAETLVNKPKPSWWKEFIESIRNWIKSFTGKILNEQEVNELVGGFVKYGTQNDNSNSKTINTPKKISPEDKPEIKVDDKDSCN